MYDRKEIQKSVKDLLKEDPEPGAYKPIIMILAIICAFTLLQTALLGAFLSHLH